MELHQVVIFVHQSKFILSCMAASYWMVLWYDTYSLRPVTCSLLVPLKACHLFSHVPITKPVLKLGTNFSKISIKIQIFSFKKVHLKIFSSAKCCILLRPPCLNSSPPGQNGHHFSRRHFQMHYLEWKWYNSDSNFTEICSQESNWQ